MNFFSAKPCQKILLTKQQEIVSNFENIVSQLSYSSENCKLKKQETIFFYLLINSLAFGIVISLFMVYVYFF